MKILLTGSTGLLGKAILADPWHVSKHEIWTLTRRGLYTKEGPLDGSHHFCHDLKDPFPSSFNLAPDIIVHCACEGSVDKVQKNPQLGYDSILLPTLNILAEARRSKSKLIFISTNAVFDGNNPPYKEDDPLCPVNHYGIMKAASELAVRGSSLEWSVVRPLLMYGWPNDGQRGNWVSTWIEKLRRGEECKAVYDVISQPLFVRDCARVVWKIIQQECWGEIFNIAGADRVSLYDLCRAVANEISASNSLVIPVPSNGFPALAPRPKDTSFDCSKARNLLGVDAVGITEGIHLMLTEGKR